MTYTELKQLIKANASPDSWLHDDMLGIWTLIPDLRITIREKLAFDLYFGASFVERHDIVGVDGYRAYLPLPDIETLRIPSDAATGSRRLLAHPQAPPAAAALRSACS